MILDYGGGCWIVCVCGDGFWRRFLWFVEKVLEYRRWENRGWGVVIYFFLNWLVVRWMVLYDLCLIFFLMIYWLMWKWEWLLELLFVYFEWVLSVFLILWWIEGVCLWCFRGFWKCCMWGGVEWGCNSFGLLELLLRWWLLVNFMDMFGEVKFWGIVVGLCCVFGVLVIGFKLNFFVLLLFIWGCSGSV